MLNLKSNKARFKNGAAMTLVAILSFMGAKPVFAQTTASAQDNAVTQKETPEYVVTIVGTRKDANHLQMKSANTVSVISSDDLEHTAVHNVAEALALLPGVNVTNSGSSYFGGVDSASRGEGMFVGVRGMNTEFTLALVNGVNVAQGMPYSRQVQLSLLPPSGLKTIVVNKNSTADMDGDAIGGTIDFRTPTAFSFKNNYASITATGRVESRARDYGEDGTGGGLNAEFSHVFGKNENIGFYASAFYDKRNYANSTIAGIMTAHNDGNWAFLHSSTDNGTGINPNGMPLEANLVQTGLNIGVSTGYTERYGGNFSLDWKYDDSLDLYLRGSYADAETQQNSTFVQFVNDKSRVYTAATGFYDLNLTNSSVRTWYETNPEDATLSTYTLGGTKRINNWTISPNIFYSEGHNDRPDHIEASARNNQSDKYNNGQKTPYSGLFITYNEDGYPIPLLTANQSNLINNSNTLLPARRAGQLTQEFSGQTKTGFKIDAQYDFESGPLSYIKTGLKFVESERNFTSRDYTNDHLANLVGKSVTWSEVGLSNSYFNSIYPGLYDNIKAPIVDQDKLFEIFYKYFPGSAMSDDYQCYLNCNTLKGREDVSSAYVTGKYQSGNLEIIPGLRYEHTDIKNVFWNQDVKVKGFQSNNTTYDEVLPSLFANYRPDNKSVYRASITRSYQRPALVQLGGGVNTSRGDGTITIRQGNPDLKTLKSWNFDASGEWDNGFGGYAMLGAYYKHLSDYMFDNGTSQVNSDNIDAGVTYNGETFTHVTFVHPTNGGDGYVKGLELQLFQRFNMLPGWFSGFGAGANFTRQWTEVDIGNGDKHRIQNAPNVLGNVKINYLWKNLSVDLNYNYSGESVVSYNDSVAKLDVWTRPTQRTDLHVGYKFNDRLVADLSVSNLFKDYTYWAHIGKNTLAINDVVDSGRTTLLSLKYTY